MGRRRSSPEGPGSSGATLWNGWWPSGSTRLVVDDLSTGHAANLPTDVRLEQLDISVADLERRFAAWRPVSSTTSRPRRASPPPSATRRDLAVNVVGSHRVATAARRAGGRAIVFVSSGGAVYGETGRAASEAARTAPVSYYGVHKLAAEAHITLAGPPCAIARPSNVDGPRQAAGLEGAVVAAFVDQAVTRGPPRHPRRRPQTRDFVHVRDVADALRRLGEPGAPVGVWNVAAGRRTSINDLADLVARAVGGDSRSRARPAPAG